MIGSGQSHFAVKLTVDPQNPLARAAAKNFAKRRELGEETLGAEAWDFVNFCSAALETRMAVVEGVWSRVRMGRWTETSLSASWHSVIVANNQRPSGPPKSQPASKSENPKLCSLCSLCSLCHPWLFFRPASSCSTEACASTKRTDLTILTTTGHLLWLQ